MSDHIVHLLLEFEELLGELKGILQKSFVGDNLGTTAPDVGVHLVDDVALGISSLDVLVSLEDLVAKLKFVEFF